MDFGETCEIPQTGWMACPGALFLPTVRVISFLPFSCSSSWVSCGQVPVHFLISIVFLWCVSALLRGHILGPAVSYYLVLLIRCSLWKAQLPAPLLGGTYYAYRFPQVLFPWDHPVLSSYVLGREENVRVQWKVPWLTVWWVPHLSPGVALGPWGGERVALLTFPLRCPCFRQQSQGGPVLHLGGFPQSVLMQLTPPARPDIRLAVSIRLQKGYCEFSTFLWHHNFTEKLCVPWGCECYFEAETLLNIGYPIIPLICLHPPASICLSAFWKNCNSPPLHQSLTQCLVHNV